ncbi:MAG TPA: tripartite tricarboxylate transporter substrate binding protein [Xanthobacteraceae bacterium]|nr:tripartite tricarboxylate transporter substrate binding protein [Xanthobacteraceae bacterium]
MRCVVFSLIRIALAAALAMLASAAPAETYPARPIRLLISFPPGGASDLIARTLGAPLSARLGQPIVVENRPGSNGNLAGELAARAAPDGYTLLLGPSSLLAVNPHLYARMAFDPLKELLPVASLVLNELILAVNPALAVKSFQDFIALARAARPPLFYASIGNGSEHHLAMEFLKQQAGIDLVHVPYRGGGPAAIGVMAGDVAAMFGGGSVAPLIQSGKLRGLAVTGQRRSQLLPELPPIAEFYPGYEVTIWQGLFAPIGTPPAIVQRLRDDMGAVLAQPDIAEKLAVAGSGEPYVTTPSDFLARIRSDYARYGKLIKDAGLAVD